MQKVSVQKGDNHKIIDLKGGKMAKETIKSLKARISELESQLKNAEEKYTNLMQPIIDEVLNSDDLVIEIENAVDNAVSNLSIS
jgi:hypothetical protein